MTVVALPVYRRRVAPVLDFSHKILLINLGHDPEELTTELLWDGLSQPDRLDALSRAGVATLICGGITESFHSMLVTGGIQVIWGIAGPIDEVLEAFKSNRLNDSIFQMPGRRAGCFDEPGDTEEYLQDSQNLSQQVKIRKTGSLASSGMTTKSRK